MPAVLLMIVLNPASVMLQPPGQTSPNLSVEKARGLSSKDFQKYLRELGAEKKFSELMAILESDIRDARDAAFVLAESLEPERAIAFCTSLELGGSHWLIAIGGLRTHPKEKVIGYYKQVATSQLKSVRAYCYIICEVEGWRDLVSLAKKDLADTHTVGLPGQREVLTLGMIAKKYVDSVSGQQRRK